MQGAWFQSLVKKTKILHTHCVAKKQTKKSFGRQQYKEEVDQTQKPQDQEGWDYRLSGIRNTWAQIQLPSAPVNHRNLAPACGSQLPRVTGSPQACQLVRQLDDQCAELRTVFKLQFCLWLCPWHFISKQAGQPTLPPYLLPLPSPCPPPQLKSRCLCLHPHCCLCPSPIPSWKKYK